MTFKGEGEGRHAGERGQLARVESARKRVVGNLSAGTRGQPGAKGMASQGLPRMQRSSQILSSAISEQGFWVLSFSSLFQEQNRTELEYRRRVEAVLGGVTGAECKDGSRG